MAQTNQELADELNAKQLDPDDLDVELIAHPEGAKRGGYIPIFRWGDASVVWDHLDEQWNPNDD